MPARLSGIDAILPAFERTTRELFKPFRFRHWAALAVVVMSTNEFVGDGGGWSGLNLLLPASLRDVLAEYAGWVVAGVIALGVLILAFIYVASVLRFVLFDSVLNNRCELRNGWRRWQRQGSSYFLWTLGFGTASMALMIVIMGGPIYLAWRSGAFANPGDHILLLVTGCVFMIILGLLLVFAIALAWVFAKDFVVPVMALENLGVMDGWRRMLPMLAAEKLAFLIYVLMKMGLAMCSAVLFGIINVLVLIAMFIPLIILSAIVGVIGGGIGLSWTPLTTSAAVLVYGVVLMLVICVMSFISVPAMVFFQAYSLHFLGPRYPLLEFQLERSSPFPRMTPPIPRVFDPLPASS